MKKIRRIICLVLALLLLSGLPVEAGVFDLFKIPGKIKAAKEAISAAKLIMKQAQEVKQRAEAAMELLRQSNYITLENARIMAVDKSNTILQNTLQLVKKNMEKKQALQAIADTRKRERTIQYSLLIKIKWPEKHGMPKEIELLTKIPQIESEIDILKRQREYEIRKVVTNADQAYYDTLLYEYVAKDLEERISADKATLEEIRRLYAKGEARKTDVEFMEKQVSSLERAYNQTIIKYDTAKSDLSDLINKNVRTGCTFEPVLSDALFDRDALPDIITYAKENDFDLYQATQKRKLAEQETNLLLGIYRDRYGSKIRDIENYINNHPDIDYENFLKKYSAALSSIDNPWTGVYKIRIIFFTLNIPKIWFKGKWDGTRYLEDEKFILYTTLVDRDAARKEEAATIKSLESAITSSYDSLKSMQSALRDAEEDLKRAQEDYQYQLEQNKKGLVSFDALESSRQSFYSNQQAQFEQLIDYSKALSTFNLETSGYVDFFLEDGSFSGSGLQAGASTLGAVTWKVNEDLTDYNFTLHVNVPDEYDCNFYKLYYGDRPVGGKNETDAPLIHTALTYNDNTLMTIRFYKNDTLRYIGTFDDGMSEGMVNLVEAGDSPTEEGPEVVGDWEVSTLDSIRSRFTPHVTKSYDYDSYSLIYDGQVVATARKNEPITSLSLYFGNMNLLSMQLLQYAQPVQDIQFQASTASSGELVAMD